MIIIPDIHGRTFWKKAIEGHETEKIIFLGDYVDPYSDEGIDYGAGILSLRDVLLFKKEHPDNVVLLLGNHDLSYISSYLTKCRHDYENHDEIKTLFKENLPLFSIAHEEWVGNRRVVFSHAGILSDWLKENEMLLGQIKRGDEVRLLNEVFHQGHLYPILDDASLYRGGGKVAGSCVWADIHEFTDEFHELLPGCYQIFGHTQVTQPVITKRFACLDCRSAFSLNDRFEFIEIDQ